MNREAVTYQWVAPFKVTLSGSRPYLRRLPWLRSPSLASQGWNGLPRWGNLGGNGGCGTG